MLKYQSKESFICDKLSFLCNSQQLHYFVFHEHSNSYFNYFRIQWTYLTNDQNIDTPLLFNVKLYTTITNYFFLKKVV